MILVKDRTGSKNGTADSTLVGVFDFKRPLYRIVKWLILHIFPPVFRLLYGFRVVGRIPEEKMQNGCISVCNHVHKLDCVMLACVFQDYTMQFLSLESNLHIPVAGAIVRLMGGIGLPAKLDGWRPVLKRIKQGLDEGQMLQIYPEGELIDGCRTLRAFQPGAFQITCWFRKPMIPCLLRFYPRFSKSGRRKRDGMELVILEPVDIPTDKRASARQQSWKRRSDVRWKRHGLQLVERVHEDCAFYCLDRAGKSCGNGAESENYLAWYGSNSSGSGR